MSEGVTIEIPIHFDSGQGGQRLLRAGAAPPRAAAPEGRPPRLARLMALAIRFDELVRTGEIEDFAAIAELGHVTRARVSQITNLLNLAPDIQEAILFLPPVRGDRDGVSEREARAIAAEADWATQREGWSRISTLCGDPAPASSTRRAQRDDGRPSHRGTR